MLKQVREKIPQTYLEAFKTINSFDGISARVISHSAEDYTVRIFFNFRYGASKENSFEVIRIIRNLHILNWKRWEWNGGNCILRICLSL